MAVYYSKAVSNGSTLGIWQLTEPSEELMQLVCLTDKELLRMEKFKAESRRREWLATRMLIQHFLGPGQVIDYTSTGKPVLTDNHVQISISHTYGYAAIILHHEKNVALDIEKPSSRILNVSDRFFNDDERKIHHLFSEEVFQTIIWCAKEAMFKWYHENELFFKDHLLIKSKSFPNQPEFDIETVIEKDGNCINLPLHCCITDEYVLVYTI